MKSPVTPPPALDRKLVKQTDFEADYILYFSFDSFVFSILVSGGYTDMSEIEVFAMQVKDNIIQMILFFFTLIMHHNNQHNRVQIESQSGFMSSQL